VGAIAHSIKTTLGLGNSESPANVHSPHSGTTTNFDKIIEIPTSFQGIDVSLYKSRETGLKVLLANVDVPIVLSDVVLGLYILRFTDISPWLQRS
jgi:hypothetical protein